MNDQDRPLLIDLYCSQGGSSYGYWLAGFRVIGVDIKPQPRFPFEFIQGDVLEIFDELPKADAYGASPPCQAHSGMTKGRWQDRLSEHVNLIPQTRELLQITGKPYAIENVVGARDELINPLMLCGSMFGLQSDYGNQIRRHRLFETNPVIWFPPQPCQHNNLSALGVYGGGQHPNRRKRANGSDPKQSGDDFGVIQQRKAMEIDWMTKSGLNQAIPPAYTEFIGKVLLTASVELSLSL